MSTLNTTVQTNGTSRINLHVARFMLIVCTAIWGGSYLSVKYCLDYFQVQWLIGIRTIGACLIIGVLFFDVISKSFNKTFVLASLLTGVTYYGLMVLQTAGLQSVEPGRSAFLTAAYCVITPFSAWLIFRKKPTLISLIAAVTCIAGVGFVALKPGMLTLSLSNGDLLTLACACSFAFNLTFLSYYTRTINPVALSFGQFVVAGILFITGAAFTEPLPNISSVEHLSVFANLFYLTVIVTVLAQVMQNCSLSVLSPSSASVIMCAESLFTLLFSVILCNEQVSQMALIGFVLIFTAIVVASLGERSNNVSKSKSKSIDVKKVAASA